MRTDIGLQATFISADLRDAAIRLAGIKLHNPDLREAADAALRVDEAQAFLAKAEWAEEDQGRILGKAAESLIRARRLVESAVEFSEGWLHHDLATVRLVLRGAQTNLTRTQGYVEGFNAGFVAGRMKAYA